MSEHQQDNNRQPDETRIEELFTAIRPQPGARFYDRMANTPWLTQGEQPDMQIVRKAPKRYAPFAYLAAAFIAVLFVVWAAPPLRAFAQDVLDAIFFDRADTNTQQHVVMSSLPPTPTFENRDYLTLTIDQAQERVAFEVLRPSALPQGYIFHTADAYDGRVVSQSYVFPSDLYRTLTITQQPLPIATTPDEIGANAVIQSVQIGVVQGEYVQGWWDSVDGSQQVKADGMTTFDSFWNPSLQFHFLRWERDGMAYEIMYQAAYLPHPALYGDGAPNEPGYLTLDDLIALAEGLQ